MAKNNILHVSFGLSARPAPVPPDDRLSEKTPFLDFASLVGEFCSDPVNKTDGLFQIEGTWSKPDFMSVRYDKFSTDVEQEDSPVDRSQIIPPIFTVRYLPNASYATASCIGVPGFDGIYKEHITERTHQGSFSNAAYAHFLEWAQAAPRHLKSVPVAHKSEVVGPPVKGRVWWTP